MFKFLKVFLFFILFFNCQNIKSKRLPVKIDSVSYFSYGTGFDLLNIVSTDYLIEKVENSPDSVQLKVKGKIIDVCSKKGCWMTLDTGEDTLFIKFRDYGFFVPIDSVEGKNAVVQGDLFLDTTSVEMLKHYAEDAGKSEEEIALITEPIYELGFIADGVIIKN